MQDSYDIPAFFPSGTDFNCDKIDPIVELPGRLLLEINCECRLSLIPESEFARSSPPSILSEDEWRERAARILKNEGKTLQTLGAGSAAWTLTEMAISHLDRLVFLRAQSSIVDPLVQALWRFPLPKNHTREKSSLNLLTSYGLVRKGLSYDRSKVRHYRGYSRLRR